MSGRGLRVVILSRGARGADGPAWGLGQDSKIMEQVCRELHAGKHMRVESVDHIDPLSFVGSPRKPRAVDVQIHLEVPCRAAWPWARYNIVVVNPEWWPAEAWNWVSAPKERGGADLIIFKSEHARALFPEVEGKRTRVLKWRAGPEIQSALGSLAKCPPRREFLYLIGASANKLAAAHVVCEAWKSRGAAWPALRVVGTEKVVGQLKTAIGAAAAPANLVFQTSYPGDSERIAAQAEYAYHVVASAAEGFGYTFAEAAAVGALPLWTDIPVYKELWEGIVGDTGCMRRSGSELKSGKYRDAIIPAVNWTTDDVARGVESLLRLSAEDEARLRGALRHAATTRVKEFRHEWRNIFGAVEHRLRSVAAVGVPPKPLAAADLPHVAVITITRNRPRWWANMARNILLSDYPPDKLTWVIADDGDFSIGADGLSGRIDEAVMKFQSVHTRVHVKYLSLPKRLDIGAKRNKACEAAPAEASVFIMMDDDDHYPAGSIAARVSWLAATGAGCVYCSTLPMYDCKNYISAINVPPLDLAPEERVSEASLACTRKFWEARKFPAAVNVAEGEGFISDRVHETAEIPPEGIIVSFLHGANATSRRVPESTEANGCHYGFDDDYFSYLCGMAT